MLPTGTAAQTGGGMTEHDMRGRRVGRPRSRPRHDGEWPERLLRSSEVAELFSVSSRTVREWARRGLLPTIRTPGGQHRVPERPVQELLHRVRGLPGEDTAADNGERGPAGNPDPR
jgi:excisionase family DNA binding protein